MSKRTSEAKVEAIDQKQIKFDLEQNMIFPDEMAKNHQLLDYHGFASKSEYGL